jgi:hypothetical protein
VILGGDRKHGVLDVLILVDLGLVERLVEVRRVVILIGDANADEFGNWRRNKWETDSRCIINVVSMPSRRPFLPTTVVFAPNPA